MKRIILAVLAVFLVAVLPASAISKGQKLNIGGFYSAPYRSSWIEQQDDWPQPDVWIQNTVQPCFWSVNDTLQWFAVGSLAPGESSVRSDCIVSDFNPVYATRFGTTASWSMAKYGFYGVSVNVPSLATTVCYEPQGRCFDVAQSLCVRANYRPDDLALKDIAASNGGRGVLTEITVTVKNPTSKRIRNISIAGGISSDWWFPAGCEGPNRTNFDYPFSWDLG